MKIAEALKKVHALKGRLAKVWAMAEENSYYVEGQRKPEFSLQDLLVEAEAVSSELRELKVRLQIRNQQVKVGGETLAAAIVRLGDLRSEVALREKVLKAIPRTSRDKLWLDDSVVVYTPAMPEKEQRQRIEELSAEIEKLDCSIQQVNWQNDL